MTNTIWDSLIVGVQALLGDIVVAVIFGLVFWGLSWIGFFTLSTWLFWLFMVILIPLSMGFYLWLKGLIYHTFWDWEPKRIRW